MRTLDLLLFPLWAVAVACDVSAILFGGSILLAAFSLTLVGFSVVWRTLI